MQLLSYNTNSCSREMLAQWWALILGHACNWLSMPGSGMTIFNGRSTFNKQHNPTVTSTGPARSTSLFFTGSKLWAKLKDSRNQEKSLCWTTPVTQQENANHSDELTSQVCGIGRCLQLTCYIKTASCLDTPLVHSTTQDGNLGL